MKNEIAIYTIIYDHNPEGDLFMKYVPADEPIPSGWTTNPEELGITSKTEQEAINKNLTLQLAQANIEIAKLKAQIGGSK